MQRSLWFSLLGLALACGDETPLASGGAGQGAANEGAANQGGTSTLSTTSTVGPSTSVWGGPSGGEGHGGEPGLGPPYPIVLAHGFFGFEEFAGVDFATYFYGVREDLTAQGELVFTPAVDPFNDSTTRGAALAVAIDRMRAETGYEKVVIIGHSQGGLDARVVAHDHPDWVAAVITVATPHGGSPIADIALGLVEDDGFYDIVDDLVELIGAPLYDQIGDGTSVTSALAQFSTPGIADFNAAYPDAPGVFYASITGRTDQSLGGQDCAADVALLQVTEWKTERDRTDLLFALTQGSLAGDSGAPHDGLVRVRDAKHGEFWGCVPADHTDEIGQIFGDSPGWGNPFDHRLLFRALTAEVRARGF